MPEPITVITLVAKKIAMDILTEPEKIIKYIFFGIIVPILIFLLILALPAVLILSIPSLLFSGSNATAELTAKQLQTISIYQEAPNTINENNLEWINNKRIEYSWCDDIIVKYNFDLTWQHFMSIDSVLLNQEFVNVDVESLIKLSTGFFNTNSYTEEYTVEEEYDKPIGHLEDCPVDCNILHTEPDIREVKKTRVYITVYTKSWEEMLNIAEITKDEDREIATNIYNTLTTMDIEGNFNIYDDIDLSDLKEYPPGDANIPYFNQADKRWGNYSYGNSKIYSGGCGPTSLAMIVAGLKGRADINPKSVADWSYNNGHRAEGQGSYWSLMTEGANNYGLKVDQVSRKNPNAIVKALSEGYPVIVSMGRGNFTNGGHFIVLRGITAQGKILVHDSASVERSNKTWDLGIIMNQSSTKGGLNGSPFWIFRP